MRRLNTQKHRLRLLQHFKESTRMTPQPVMVDDLNMTLQFSCYHYIVLCGVTLIALRNAATEIVHRRHIQTTQGTTLKRTLQDCTGHIHTTMTQGTTEEGGIVTWRVSRSAAGRKSMMIYVSPISSKTLRGASASCGRRQRKEKCSLLSLQSAPTNTSHTCKSNTPTSASPFRV